MTRTPLRRVRAALALAAASALLVPALALAGDTSSTPAPGEGGPQDATVVAVIDSGISPYHQDFVASRMPQHRNTDPSDDLPLDQAPHTWLPGFPSPSAFAGYDSLDLSMADAAKTSSNPAALDARDAAQWNKVQTSTSAAPRYYWVPDSKLVGALTFARGGKIHGTTSEHGMGTSSSAVGNTFGTCPSCVFVFIEYGTAADAEDAIGWALAQPWIDVISNSYGFSTVNRDRLYSGSDTAAQKAAVDRGQQVFFSAGNGQENAFLVPNTTLLSSQEGPDWIVTVTATNPRNKGSYTGTGKPADVAGLGTDYPTSYQATTTSGTGSFGGTSNATPQVAGAYAEALYRVRKALPGASRVQEGGVIARGPAGCGATRPDCELADGALTGRELRDRLLLGAVSHGNGFDAGSQGVGAPTPRVLDTHRAAEGHGTYFGRWAKDGVSRYSAELDRLTGPVLGTSAALPRPEGERAYFVADSFCRQHLWGSWSGGYWDGREAVPAADPQQPTRTLLAQGCPLLPPQR